MIDEGQVRRRSAVMMKAIGMNQPEPFPPEVFVLPSPLAGNAPKNISDDSPKTYFGAKIFSADKTRKPVPDEFSNSFPNRFSCLEQFPQAPTD
jgi:hypothetical protein